MANSEWRMANETDMPRWAEELGAETWQRINELLYEGWQPAAVRRELDIPDSKKRSLEVHARKYRHRRILAPLARLNELLAGGAESIGPDYLTLLRMVIEQGLTDETKCVRTAAVLGKFFGKILEVGAKQEEEAERRDRESRRQTVMANPQEAVRALLEMYGVAPDRAGDEPRIGADERGSGGDGNG